MKRVPLALLTAVGLAMAPQLGAMAQISTNLTDSESSYSTNNSNAAKRTYPGGRDDTDLTVQPKKTVTKKESMDYDEIVDEDFGQGDTASGFGE